MKNRKVIIQKSLLSISSLFLLCILLEICGHIYLNYFAKEDKFLKYASLKQLTKRHKELIYSPHRYLGYYLRSNYQRGTNKHNSLGYRGEEIVQPKPIGCFRIVCLGGSTTYTTAIEDYKMSYPALLEKELQERGYCNVEVINAGVGKYSSWETLINFEFRVLDLSPDMIIIYQGINDIHPRLVWPPEVYKGDNSGSRISNDTSLLARKIFERLTILRFLLIKAGFPSSYDALSRSIYVTPDTFYGFEFKQQKINKTYPKGIFKEVSAKKMLETNKPVFYQRNTENIIAIAKSRRIISLLVTFAYISHFTDRPRVASAEYISAFHEMNQTLKSVAEQMGVNIFDLASVFPKEKEYFTDGRHVNLKGVQLKAKLFADYIVEHNMIPNNK